MMMVGNQKCKESSNLGKVERLFCIYLEEMHDEFHVLENAYTKHICGEVVLSSNILLHEIQIYEEYTQPKSK